MRMQEINWKWLSIQDRTGIFTSENEKQLTGDYNEKTIDSVYCPFGNSVQCRMHREKERLNSTECNTSFGSVIQLSFRFEGLTWRQNSSFKRHWIWDMWNAGKLRFSIIQLHILLQWKPVLHFKNSQWRLSHHQFLLTEHNNHSRTARQDNLQ